MQSENFHISPSSKTPYTESSPYAGLASRALALVIDLLILAALLAIGGFTGNLIIDALSFSYRTEQLMRIVLGLSLSALPVTYHLLFWTLAGQTPGKAILGIRVVMVDGSPVTLRRSGVRLLGYVASSFFLIGFLMVLVHPRRQALHDKLARTVVIYASRDDTPDDEMETSP